MNRTNWLQKWLLGGVSFSIVKATEPNIAAVGRRQNRMGPMAPVVYPNPPELQNSSIVTVPPVGYLYASDLVQVTGTGVPPTLQFGAVPDTAEVGGSTGGVC